MHLSSGLAVIGPQDAPGVLDEPSFLGDGCGEEQGVQVGGPVGEDEALPAPSQCRVHVGGDLPGADGLASAV
jgi:hypothetical protein